MYLLGGAATTNPAWVRIKSQILPGVLRVVPAVEPVATGAALVAAVRAGCVGPAVPTLAWRAGPPVTPARADYDRSYARFVAAATARETT